MLYQDSSEVPTDQRWKKPFEAAIAKVKVKLHLAIQRAEKSGLSNLVHLQTALQSLSKLEVDMECSDPPQAALILEAVRWLEEEFLSTTDSE